MPKKEYLGDGCYCEHDGFGLVLTTENGVEVSNRIVLDPEVYSALLTYVERLKAAHDHNKHCTADKVVRCQTCNHPVDLHDCETGRCYSGADTDHRCGCQKFT